MPSLLPPNSKPYPKPENTLVMPRRTLLRIVCLICCGVWLFAPQSPLAAQETTPDPLWRLVRKDVGIAVELREWRQHRETLIKQPLAGRLQAHPLWQVFLQGRDRQKLQELQQHVQQLTGMGLLELADAWFGKQAILAVYPHSAEKSEAVFLTRLASAADADRLRAAWEKLDHRIGTVEKRGTDSYIVSRREPGQEPAPPIYFATFDDTLVVTDHLPLLGVVFDLRAGRGLGSITELRGFTRWNELLPETLPTRVYLQPEAWKFLETAAYDPNSTDPVQRAITRGWPRCEAIGFSLDWRNDLVVRGFAYFPGGPGSESWKRLQSRLSGPPQILERVPAEALLVAAGRHDLPGLWNMIRTELESRGAFPKPFLAMRQLMRGLMLGNDPFDDLIAQLPPDFGVFVTAESAADPAPPVPLSATVAILLPSDAVNATGRPTPQAALENALHTGMVYLTTLAGDSAEIAVQTQPFVSMDKFVWLSGLKELQPGYGFSRNWLVIASHPGAAVALDQLSRENSLANAPWYQELSGRYFPQASQVALWNVRQTRHVGAQFRERFATAIRNWHSVPEDIATRSLDRVDEWLQLADVVFAAATMQEDVVLFTAGVATLPTPAATTPTAP